jgi:NAD(P)-dependent dehydrogenase (short-subunit alcohol dehydrogenase family)
MSTIIITGSSRGIGAATALLAADHGYAVCVNYLNRTEAADQVVTKVTEAGGKAISLQADISSEPDVIRMFETVDRELGTLTALVNNAAVLAPQSRVEDLEIDRINQLFGVNVTGSFLCAREAVRRMSTRNGGEGGAIVNVSSGAATLGSPGVYVDYAATKGAIDIMTIGLAREVADEGIRVNAVRPGFIHTEMHTTFGEPDRVDRLAPSVPMKRGGQPEEVAQAIVWLLSDKASYTTGTIIDVAGGN